MSEAKRCPVCFGEGMVALNKNLTPSTYVNTKKVTCHGCGGRGWVEVGGFSCITWPIQPNKDLESEAKK